MMLRLLAGMGMLLLAMTTHPAAAQDQGRIIEYSEIAAAGLPPQRLSIWLPPGYDGSNRSYPVVYMHDGHNLFDRRNSNFDKIWAADKAMLAVMGKGIEPRIIVGIWAPGEDRFRQYLPKPAYDAAPPELRAKMDVMAKGPVTSSRYLAWIGDVLKPWVDRSFRTRPAKINTAIIGSSMGGLMSCYAIAARPEVFGRAACLSSHWPAAIPDAVAGYDAQAAKVWRDYFSSTLGKPDARRVWMDHGDAALDQFYAPYQKEVDQAFASAGWQEGADFESRFYPGASHDEDAWAARLPEVLEWLFRP